ncbi:hypothetical protein D3C85_1840700 [compost metagenome]
MARVRYCSPRVLRAIDMPPEAEPVMPARMFTATASDTSGLLDTPRTRSRITTKPASEAITVP